MRTANKSIHIKEIKQYMRKTARKVWCGGCGNGIVMGALIRAIIDLKIPHQKIAIVSGIGCSGRGSAYIDLDSIQTPHGRTIPVATGIKLTRPDMHVVIYSGDGDLAAIGGNHFIHAARRNIDITTILVNNFIFGMTGGQVTPTTPFGAIATTAPYGNIELPFDLCGLAAAAGATYVARGTTYHVNQLISHIEKAIKNKGFSFVEVISQCPTQYGKLDKIGTAAQMLLWIKENTANIGKAGSKTLKESEGKVIIGEFISRDRPELTESYIQLNQKVQKEGAN